MQNRLSRVIAYSSVENSGLIITGFGVALTGSAVGNQRLVAIGLLAATLQMVTHTAAKCLLFSSATGLELVAGGDDLEVLRGVGRRAPWSGTGLAVGSLTLAGLPPRVRRVPAWRSATIGVDGAGAYTPFGYANPARRVLASVLHTRAGVREVTPGQGGAADGHVDRVPHLHYASDVVEVVESWPYRPLARMFAAVVAVAKRLQSGRLDAYLFYMLIALVAVIAVVTAMA